MAEYIELETFLKEIEDRYCLPCKKAGRDHNGCKCDVCCVEDMRGDVIDAPAADVAPVVHGQWKASGGLLECQNCGEIYSTLGGNEGKAWDYCPDCGARMDGA